MEEAIELLKADGQRVSQEEVRKLWKEIENYRERNGETLSLDEMEAVSGGKRDWVTEGCVATAEYGSSCWTGNDACIFFLNVQYSNQPQSQQCPRGGIHLYIDSIKHEGAYGACMLLTLKCKKCGYTKEEIDYDDDWQG